MTSHEKALAVVGIIHAIVDLIEAHPHGISGGELYAMMMTKSISLEAFERLMELVLVTGKVKKDMPHHYVAVRS